VFRARSTAVDEQWKLFSEKFLAIALQVPVVTFRISEIVRPFSMASDLKIVGDIGDVTWGDKRL
jgi:hypothetical protein